jgi:MarR family transcriptional regulator, organic hydroperoxide resistance regulator
VQTGVSIRKASLDNLPLDQHLCFAVYSSWSVINRTYTPILAEFGLTYTQYIVLTVLWEKDNQNVKSLGKKLFLGSNTLTPVLKRLEEKDLIQRVRDRSDDRLVNVFLTEKGRCLAPAAAIVPFCIPEITHIPVAELKQIKEKIQEIRALISAQLEVGAEIDIGP